jgi:hypothetical protein
MARIRKGKNLGPVAVRTLAAQEKGASPRIAERRTDGPRTVQRVIEFPKPPAAAGVISERIIFEVGDDRFAINWTAEPAARGRTEAAELGPLISGRALNAGEQRMTFGPRTIFSAF